MAVRDLGEDESRKIGAAIGDMFVAFGHPLTCNGGNPDLRGHHDHQVLMRIDDDKGLVCPECGRVQPIPRDLTVHWHIGRSWHGHVVEDRCPCVKAACGLVVQASADPECYEHSRIFARSIRQAHPSSSCPAAGT